MDIPKEKMKQPEYCDICRRAGKWNTLKVYQINFDEAIKFCEDDTCTYPMGSEGKSEIIINRNFADIINSPKKNDATQTSKKPNQRSNEKPVQRLNAPPQKIRLPSISKLVPPIQSKQNILPSYSKSKKDSLEKVLSKSSTSEKQKLTVKKSSNNGSLAAKLPDFGISSNDKVLQEPWYLQWQNKDALCWLDVLLCLLVHSKQLENNIDTQCSATSGSSSITTEKSLLVMLMKAYRQACELVNRPYRSGNPSDSLSVSKLEPSKKTEMNVPESSSSKDMVQDFQYLSVRDNEMLKTGAGFHCSTSLLPSLTSADSQHDIVNAISILQDVREVIFQNLQPRLKCAKGKNDSPVFALPLLTVADKSLEKLMTLKYRFYLRCEACGYEQVDHYEKVLTTFPSCVEDFCMSEPAFLCPCYKCHTPFQRRVMTYERLSEMILFHFVEGQPYQDPAKLDFVHSGKHYRVRGLIQYRNDPDHFVTWIRDDTGTRWLECDDLKSPVCQFKEMPLTVPPNQMHIVMWEAVQSSSYPEQVQQNGGSKCLSDSTTKVCLGHGPAGGEDFTHEISFNSSDFQKVDISYKSKDVPISAINVPAPKSLSQSDPGVAMVTDITEKTFSIPEELNFAESNSDSAVSKLSYGNSNGSRDSCVTNENGASNPYKSVYSPIPSSPTTQPESNGHVTADGIQNPVAMDTSTSSMSSVTNGSPGLMVVQLTPSGEIVPVQGTVPTSYPLNVQTLLTLLNQQRAKPVASSSPESATIPGIMEISASKITGKLTDSVIDKLQGKGKVTLGANCLESKPEDKPESQENIKVNNAISLLRALKNKKTTNSLATKSHEKLELVPSRKKKEATQKASGLSWLNSMSKQAISPRLGKSAVNGTSGVPSFHKSKKFAGYRSENSQSVKSGSNSGKEDSRASSPALSTQSDTALVHKRKSDFDRLSQMQKFKKRKSMDSVSLPDMDLAQIEEDADSSLQQSDEVMDSEEISNSQECDILQSLYSALSLPLPNLEGRDDTPSPIKRTISEDQFIPDVSDLENFLEGDTQNPVSNMDDFLSFL